MQVLIAQQHAEEWRLFGMSQLMLLPSMGMSPGGDQAHVVLRPVLGSGDCFCIGQVCAVSKQTYRAVCRQWILVVFNLVV